MSLVYTAVHTWHDFVCFMVCVALIFLLTPKIWWRSVCHILK